MIFIIGILFTPVSAQQFLIDGQVTHEFEKDLENIHIYNSTTTKGTLTNKEGKFKITVSIGDTLVVSSVQFLAVNQKISWEHYMARAITIELVEGRTELDEVILKTHNLTGNLAKDASMIPVTPEINALSLGIIKKEIKPMTSAERDLYTATTGWVIGPTIPINPVINAISGRTKMLKNRVKLERDNKAIEELLVKFPPSFFQEQLDVSEEKLYDFLFFCEADPLFNIIINSTKFKITEFFIEKAEQFKKRQRE